MLRTGLTFLIFSMLSPAYAQFLNKDLNLFPECEIVESQSQKHEISYDYSDEFEGNIDERSAININKADEEDLKKLQLNEIQIQNLQKYIEEYGELTSIYEMNLIEGFDSLLLKSIEPFIKFELNTELYPITLENIKFKGRHTILMREQRILEHQKGYDFAETDPDSINQSPAIEPNTFVGSPDKIMFKYAYNYYNRLRFGVTLEKDAGESLKKGFDFAGIHLSYRSQGWVRRFLAGDYNVHFGQGLTIGTGFNQVTDPFTGGYNNSASSISPSTAANEGIALRGIAVKLAPLRHSDFTFFYSIRKLDATSYDSIRMVSEDGFYYENAIKTIIETGLHRTEKEISLKGRLGQSVIGGNFSSRYKIFRIGATATFTSFDQYLKKNQTTDQLFKFSGKNLINYGADLSIVIKSLLVFSEISGSNNGSKAFIGGLRSISTGDYGFTLFFRHYDKNYQNFFSSSWSQNSDCSNETGFYNAIWLKLRTRWMVSAGADIFTFPWLKYRADAPTAGREFFIRSDIGFNSGSAITVKYIINEKSLNNSSHENMLNYPSCRVKHDLRIDLSYSALESLSFKNRLEFNFNKTVQGVTKGFMIFHDVEYHNEGVPVKLNFRYLLFDTDDFENRFFTYENDLLYAWSVPSFSGKGSRFYAMVKFEVNRHAAVWLKYGITTYYDRTTVGTGNEESTGSKRSEFKCQVIVKI